MLLRSLIYKDNVFIGEGEISPQNNKSGVWTREIRISHFSPPSDRCPPLAVLYTIASAADDGDDGFCFKMESPSPSDDSPIFSLYAACLREKKTAVVPIGKEELHLVAMPSKANTMQYSCFWGFTVASGLYNSCLVMLNLRCLGIVFDLDETLVVANTMRSFEDRIYNLQQKISNETDQQRLAAMLAEIKRYQEDKSILKQFVENDQVVENGKVFKVQNEVVSSLPEIHQEINRPVIRLQERNVVLTRVNPSIRDTSVLVRVRPAWEELRSYLTARGRKRFDVYVCTMAERDYALEIWRLLDPEGSLISSNELLDRIVSVNSGSKKSLLGVFQDGNCHPKMALVIDDRLSVWDSKDKPRVHVVPAFAPYFAPQAEMGSSVPILCVARNVACNVRGGFFKEFDDGLLPCITAAYYEDEISKLPSAPDVSNYLIPEEDTSVTNGNKDSICFEGMADVEVERRLKEANCNGQSVPFIIPGANCSSQDVPPMVNNFNHMQTPVYHGIPSSFGPVPLAAPQMIMPYSNNPFPQAIVPIHPLGQPSLSEHSVKASPAREEGEVNELELDPDTRRRLLILQHGQDARGTPPPLELRSHLEVTIPPAQTPETWLPVEKELGPRQPNKTFNEYPLPPETKHYSEKRSQRTSTFFGGEEDSYPGDRTNFKKRRLPAEVNSGNDNLRRSYSRSNSFSGKDMSRHSVASRTRDEHLECGQVIEFSKDPVDFLQGIAAESGAKVEYRMDLLSTIELQFFVEVWFVEERIGNGIGRTRMGAQKQAALKAIRYLADHYLNDFSRPTAFRDRKLSQAKEMGFLSDSNLHGCSIFSRNDPSPNTSEDSRYFDHRVEGSTKSLDSVATLKELCTLQGFSLSFKADPSFPSSSDNKQEVNAQVEIAGQVLGKGTGNTWNLAKLQASEEALANLNSMLGPFTQKCSGSPRLQQMASGKNWKTDTRICQGDVREYKHLVDTRRI